MYTPSQATLFKVYFLLINPGSNHDDSDRLLVYLFPVWLIIKDHQQTCFPLTVTHSRLSMTCPLKFGVVLRESWFPSGCGLQMDMQVAGIRHLHVGGSRLRVIACSEQGDWEMIQDCREMGSEPSFLVLQNLEMIHQWLKRGPVLSWPSWLFIIVISTKLGI